MDLLTAQLSLSALRKRLSSWQFPVIVLLQKTNLQGTFQGKKKKLKGGASKEHIWLHPS